MFTRTLALAAFTLGLLILPGCSSAPKLEKVGVRIQSIVPSAAGTTVNLRFINPNNTPLIVTGTQHTLSLGGTVMGVLKNKKALGVPSLGTVDESLPLSTPVSAAVARFFSAHPGSAVYTLESTLHLNWDDDIYDYKTVDQGSVTLP